MATIHVAETGAQTPKGVRRCEMGSNVAFSTESLESYFFAGWEPTAYDALLVAATVEFADRILRRSGYVWPREIGLRIPVHDVARWRERRVEASLHEALAFTPCVRPQRNDQRQRNFARSRRAFTMANG